MDRLGKTRRLIYHPHWQASANGKELNRDPDEVATADAIITPESS